MLRGWRGHDRRALPPARPRGRLGHPAARRDDPAHEPHEPVQRGRRRRGGAEVVRAPRRADRDRRRGHARRRGRLHGEFGLPVIGVPKTIDNDLAGTDQTFGFDTAVSIATEAIDRLHTTAESHDRVMVVEVMGRHAGWLAVDERHRRRRRRRADPRVPAHRRALRRADQARHARDKDFSIVVVSEGWPLTREEGAEELTTHDPRARRVRPRAPRRRRQQLADLLERSRASRRA